MSDIAISVEHLGKQYRIGKRERYRALRDVITDGIAAPFRRLASFGRQPSNGHENGAGAPDTFWALKDVSFEVKRGEVLGIIGRNGAGKSTLLKVLSRITEPTEGRVRVVGRVGSLLEVGTGFHPELTGRENIFLNGAILGMKRADIIRQFDEIVAFAEVEQFIDTPVKHYSSGMYVRLAFSVAAHLEPEILIVDEVLAVGDAAFQKKCLGKMGDVANEGRTVLFVSHNMGAIENLCMTVLVLTQGNLGYKGETHAIVGRYLQSIYSDVAERQALGERTDRSGNGRIRFTHFHVEDACGNPLDVIKSGMPLVFVFGYQCKTADYLRQVDVGFSIASQQGQMLSVLYASYTHHTFQVSSSVGEFRCRVNDLPLAAGRYYVGARITVGGEEADWPRDSIGYVDVEAGDFYGTGSSGFGSGAPLLVTGTWTECEYSNS